MEDTALENNVEGQEVAPGEELAAATPEKTARDVLPSAEDPAEPTVPEAVTENAQPTEGAERPPEPPGTAVEGVQGPDAEENNGTSELEPTSVQPPLERGSESFFNELLMTEDELKLYLKPVAPVFVDHERDSFNCENLLCDLVFKNSACIFVETDDKVCDQAIDILKSLRLEFYVVRLDKIEKGEEIKELLFNLLKRKQLPVVFLKGQLIGSYEELWYLNFTGLISRVFEDKEGTYELNFLFDYDLVVLGGGPAGIAAALETARLGRKVALINYVAPTPRGRSWDIGGTSTNVGTVTKNLLYAASSYGDILESYGIETADADPPNWRKLMNDIDDYIKSLNFSIKCKLKEAGVETFNALARFHAPHDIELTFPTCGEKKLLTTSVAVVATGSRPRIPAHVRGLAENGHTVEELLRCAFPPGRTLVLTSGYLGLEMATILAALSNPVTVLVEQPISKEIDWSILRKAKSHMKQKKIVFLEKLQIESIQKVEVDNVNKLKVTGLQENQVIYEDYFDTVLYEYGRIPNTSHLGLCKIGIKVDRRTRKIMVDSSWRTTIQHIFAVGDVVNGWPELSSLAKKSGGFLIERIYKGILKDIDLNCIPERIILPVEYARIGETEQAALAKYGNRLKTYSAESRLWGNTSSSALRDYVYMKVLCLEEEQQIERVIAIHLMCRGAAEMAQGFAISLKNGMTKKDLDDHIAIHATFSEAIVNLKLNAVKTPLEVYKEQRDKEKLESIEKAVEETRNLRGKGKGPPPAQFPLDERCSDDSACERARERNREPSTLAVLNREAEGKDSEEDSQSSTSSSSATSSSTSDSTTTSSSGDTSSSSEDTSSSSEETSAYSSHSSTSSENDESNENPTLS